MGTDVCKQWSIRRQAGLKRYSGVRWKTIPKQRPGFGGGEGMRAEHQRLPAIPDEEREDTGIDAYHQCDDGIRRKALGVGNLGNRRAGGRERDTCMREPSPGNRIICSTRRNSWKLEHCASTSTAYIPQAKRRRRYATCFRAMQAGKWWLPRIFKHLEQCMPVSAIMVYGNRLWRWKANDGWGCDDGNAER